LIDLENFAERADALLSVFIQVTKYLYPEIVRQGLEAIGVVWK